MEGFLAITMANNKFNTKETTAITQNVMQRA